MPGSTWTARRPARRVAAYALAAVTAMASLVPGRPAVAGGLEGGNRIDFRRQLQSIGGLGVYWVGTSLGATRAFIQIADARDGYRVSKRLRAFAAYSRFIRPSAHRVPVRIADTAIKATAFRNADGSMIVDLLNTGTAAVSTSFATDTAIRGQTTYLTDETHAVTQVGATAKPDGAYFVRVDLAPRALTAVVLG